VSKSLTTTATATSGHPRQDFSCTPLLINTDIRSIIGVTLIALIVRTFYISYPHQAIFDEIPIGDHLSQYIKGTFFIDVEPPFGKLLLAGIAYLSGYDGNYDFTNIGA
jgi:dolichyl-phosphate-mannose-protein mannosyltransferase